MPEVESSNSCCLMTALLRIKTRHIPFPVWLGQSHPMKYLLSLVHATYRCCALTRDYHSTTNVCRRQIGRLRRESDLECRHKVKPRTQMPSSASPLLDRDKTSGTAFAPFYLRVCGKMGSPCRTSAVHRTTAAALRSAGHHQITAAYSRITKYNIPPFKFSSRSSVESKT